MTESSSKKALITVFAVVFLDLLGFGLVVPILPYYADAYGASAVELGLLMACYSGMQFFFSPLWGRLSDKIGRRKVLLYCIFGLGVSMLVLGTAQSLAMLFVARLMGGLFGANISVASAYIADITPPEKRAKGMGLIGAAFGMGFLFGPALGGFLSQWGYGFPALVASGLSLINLIFATAVLKEPKIDHEERAKNRAPLHWSFWWKTITDLKTGLSIILFFLVTMGLSQLETSFGLFLLKRFQLDANVAGYILAAMALVMAGVQGGGIGKLVKRFGEPKLVITGTAIMALTLWFNAHVYVMSILVTLFLLQAFGYAMTSPSLSSLTSRNAQPGRQGATMGVYQSAGSLGRIIGPLLAGFLFDHAGIAVPFMAAAGIFALACLVAFGGRNNWKHVGVAGS